MHERQGTCLSDVQVAIGAYGEIIRWIGDMDAPTRRFFEGILAIEEGHVDDMFMLLKSN